MPFDRSLTRTVLIALVPILVVLIILHWGAGQHVSMQSRLPAEEESLVVPPALNIVPLSDGHTVVQTFVTAPESLRLVTLGVSGYTGNPALHVTLRNGSGQTVATWFGLASSAVDSPIMLAPTIQISTNNRYALTVKTSPTGIRGARPGTIDLRAEPGQGPSPDRFTIDGHRSPHTLGLVLTFSVPFTSYLARYPLLVTHLWPGGPPEILTLLLHVIYIAGLIAVLFLLTAAAIAPRRFGLESPVTELAAAPQRRRRRRSRR